MTPVFDGVDQPGEGVVVGLHPHQRHVAHRAGLVGGQGAAQRGDGEDPGLGLGEHAQRRQRAEEATECRRISPGRVGDVRHGPWPVDELVGETELGGDVEALRDLESGQHLHHLDRRRWGSFHLGSLASVGTWSTPLQL